METLLLALAPSKEWRRVILFHLHVVRILKDPAVFILASFDSVDCTVDSERQSGLL